MWLMNSLSLSWWHQWRWKSKKNGINISDAFFFVEKKCKLRCRREKNSSYSQSFCLSLSLSLFPCLFVEIVKWALVPPPAPPPPFHHASTHPPTTQGKLLVVEDHRRKRHIWSRDSTHHVHFPRGGKKSWWERGREEKKTFKSSYKNARVDKGLRMPYSCCFSSPCWGIDFTKWTFWVCAQKQNSVGSPTSNNVWLLYKFYLEPCPSTVRSCSHTRNGLSRIFSLYKQ